jgi:hypothetical protein
MAPTLSDGSYRHQRYKSGLSANHHTLPFLMIQALPESCRSADMNK